MKIALTLNFKVKTKRICCNTEFQFWKPNIIRLKNPEKGQHRFQTNDIALQKSDLLVCLVLRNLI